MSGLNPPPYGLPCLKVLPPQVPPFWGEALSEMILTVASMNSKLIPFLGLIRISDQAKTENQFFAVKEWDLIVDAALAAFCGAKRSQFLAA